MKTEQKRKASNLLLDFGKFSFYWGLIVFAMFHEGTLGVSLVVGFIYAILLFVVAKYDFKAKYI